VNGMVHWLGENEPSDSWSRFGWAIRVTLAAYVQANPIGAAQHGITARNFEDEANRRISDFIDSEFIIKGDQRGEELARQCALGNPAACDH